MKNKLSGLMQSVIVGVAGIAGQFLGVVIARVIGMADGLGISIGMLAGVMLGMNFLIPYFEKRNKEEPEDN
ncbi:MAG: hypothetical protein QF380_07515 [Candidatus Marinimicrobia bacterium]|nr:hypothetical protein [Candidatus Neomarinimicrobiota bacterium]